MYRITCHNKDCPTPHFYVDPKGGRIPIVTAPEAPDLKATFAQIRDLKPVIQRAETDPDNFTEEDEAILKEWWKKLQEQKAVTTGKTKIELEENEELDDYLIAYCETNHQNYIPFKNTHRKVKRDKRKTDKN